MAQELVDIDPDEVAIVKRGAIGRRFSLMKSADDKLTLAKAVAEALDAPTDNEASFIDSLRKSGVSDDAQEGLVAAARLLKAFSGDLTIDVASMLKAKDKTETPEQIAKALEQLASRDELVVAIAKHGDKPAGVIKEQLIARASALEATDALPDAWGVKKSAPSTKESGMGNSAPVPVRKADGTWDLSGVEDDAQRSFYATFLKSLDDAHDESKKLAGRLEKSETRATELEGKLTEKELVAKAEADFSHIAKADELTPILKAAKEHFDDETFEKLEKVLKAADARIETGDLFAELGRSADPAIKAAIRKGEVVDSGGDAWAKIEELAKAIVEKSGDEPLSKEQAIDRVLKTAEGRALYADYLAESRGGVV